MANQKLVKVDPGSLPNLTGQWTWNEEPDFWSAIDKSGNCRVFLSPDRTVLRIRGALGNAAGAQLEKTVEAVLTANTVTLTGYDLATFKTILAADVIAEVGRHPDFREIGLVYAVQ
jgi:hypothetical protein